MRLQRLELSDIRSYERATLRFPAGVTVLVGRNAQGKTNLLEAVHRLSTGSSHRAANDGPMVRFGTQRGVIRCEMLTDEGRRRTIELEVASGRRTRTRVDGQDVRRAAHAIGVLRCVLFAPEDLAIVRGDPSERRRFLDEVLAQRRPAYAAAKAEHDRVLRQRNQLLKQLRSLSGPAREAAGSSLEVWTEQLISHGTQITAARIAAVRRLSAPVDQIYRDLADRPEPISLHYRSSAGDELPSSSQQDDLIPETAPIAEALRLAFERRHREELARGTTLVGPHRDDLELMIGELPARGYSSHGEAWSLALSLKLATYDMLAEVGDRPIVLLDDVFAELDVIRRQRLATACAGFDQVLVTAAVEEDVPMGGAKVDVALADGVTTLAPRTPIWPEGPTDLAAGAVTDG